MRCPRCRTEVLDPTQYDSTGMITCRCGHRAYAGYVAEADARESPAVEGSVVAASPESVLSGDQADLVAGHVRRRLAADEAG